MKNLIQNGKELTDKEYRIYLEGMAEGVWLGKIVSGEQDGTCKFNDPLYISRINNVYSYVFDFHDGGRHHKFKNLKEIHNALIKESGYKIGKVEHE